jgi:hypothetical protein
MMQPSRFLHLATFSLLTVLNSTAQIPSSYPRATTDRLVHQKTPMAPPQVNTRFADPDFGSQMVRVTDATTNTMQPGSFFRNEGSGQKNEWSRDSKKFYVVGRGGYEFAFGFNPSTMHFFSLPNAAPGKGLLLPLRPGSTFSFVDSDLIYGTTSKTPLSITSYRFSSGVSKTVVDTTTCGTRPALAFQRGSIVSDDDVSLSGNDSRLSISEGGPAQGKHPFVVVYDKHLGCRWYNTQTGEIGGQWGAAGQATIENRFLVRHAYLSRSGKFIRIEVNWDGWYVWNVESLQVTHCPLNDRSLHCAGYAAVGYNNVISSLGFLDGMNIGKRKFSNLAQITPLVWPLDPPVHFGQEKHFTWSNAYQNDRAPVCISTWNYEGETEITDPFDGEIFCMETDGLASTVWRFAHNRALWIDPYFQTQPLGNVSTDGHFYLFTSNWDGQLGMDVGSVPRSDVWILRLD